MENDLTRTQNTIVDEIQDLLAAAADEAAPLWKLEETLTSGYAHALALEGERLRLEHELEAKMSDLGNDGGRFRADELAQLARRISTADGDIGRLRSLLGTLRVRASALRGDAPHAAG